MRKIFVIFAFLLLLFIACNKKTKETEVAATQTVQLSESEKKIQEAQLKVILYKYSLNKEIVKIINRDEQSLSEKLLQVSEIRTLQTELLLVINRALFDKPGDSQLERLFYYAEKYEDEVDYKLEKELIKKIETEPLPLGLKNINKYILTLNDEISRLLEKKDLSVEEKNYQVQDIRNYQYEQYSKMNLIMFYSLKTKTDPLVVQKQLQGTPDDRSGPKD